MARNPKITNRDMHRLRAWIAFRAEKERADSSGFAALTTKLRNARVVPATSIDPGIVTMHSRVLVRDPRSPEPTIYTLVFPEDDRWEHRRLSVLAPKGSAILGRRKGDSVRFDTLDGARCVTIEEVLYQPEAAGDLHL